MRYLVNDSIDPYFNMAFDEWCLENMDPAEPVFYLWRNRPSVIIGYNQCASAEVNLPYLEKKGILLVRRVTGGGAVYHDLQNLNYSFVGHGVGPEPFVQALRSIGVNAELNGRNDVFVDGRKVSGFAKSLRRGNEIVHGTMMYDVDIETLTEALSTPGSKLVRKGVESVRSRVTNLKDYLPSFASLEDVRLALHRFLESYVPVGFRCGTGEIKLSEDDFARIRHIADTKFASSEWIFSK